MSSCTHDGDDGTPTVLHPFLGPVKIIRLVRIFISVLMILGACRHGSSSSTVDTWFVGHPVPLGAGDIIRIQVR